MKRSPVRLLVLAVASVLTAVVMAVPAQAAAPYCGITWGSTAEGVTPVDAATGTTLVGVRAGRQACFDRLVLDVRGVTSLRAWRVEYVSAVSEDPSGSPVPLRGGAYLQITAGVSDHDGQGRVTYRPADRRELTDVSGFATFRQVAWAGSFEGLTSVGVGVRARLPFRVFTLAGVPGSTNGVRLVVDVAHRW